MPDTQISAITSHLAECETCRDKHAQTAKYISQLAELGRLQVGDRERRHEPRIPAAESASMKMVYPSPADRMDINVVNVSKGGLQLRVPEFLAPGVVIQILLKSLIMTAEVRYCLRVEDEFHAGVEIQDIFPGGSRKP